MPLLDRARSGTVVILDTRPTNEFAAGHIAGALSVPVDELKRRLADLPKAKEFVAYCRGPYCVYPDRAVEMLQESGRAHDGWTAASSLPGASSATGRMTCTCARARFTNRACLPA